MGFNLNTDFSSIEPNEGASGSFFPVSDSGGWLCEMIASDGRENSAKNGQILVCQLKGLEGPVNGKLHDFTINLANPNQQAVNIGLGELSAIAHVTGHIRIGNSSEWHHKPFRVVITQELDKDTKQPTGRNRISKFLDVNGNGPKEAGRGPMNGGGAGGGFGGNQQQQNNQGGGFNGNQQQNNGGQQQQNNGGWGNNNAGGNAGNQGQDQSGSAGGQGGFGNNGNQNGGGFGGGQNGGGGFQQQNNDQQQNNQGAQPNPGSQFQPNGNQQQNNGGGFQQNNGGQQNGGGWNR